MYRSRYKYKTVAQAAAGHWSGIARTIAPQLGQAIDRAGRHCPCPVHGGKDGFRVYKDFEETGGGSSNKDGQFANGFRLLIWVLGGDPDNRETFYQMVDRVGDIICPHESFERRQPQKGDVMERAGVLQSFGMVPHRFDDPTQPPGYCVVIKTTLGEQKFFTYKLKDAIAKYGLRVGEFVSVRRTDITEAGGAHRKYLWGIERAERQFTKPQRKTILEVQSAPLSPTELSESADKIWKQSVKLDFSDPQQAPAHKYLARRGIDVSTDLLNEMDSVRFHPNLVYFDAGTQKVLGYFPALVFAVRRFDNAMINCHRIYLDKDGAKAPVPQPKKMTAVASGQSVSGAAIPLLKPHHGLIGIAEGPETALAAATATGLAVWSTVSAGMMENFIPPKDVKCLIVFADKDASKTGQKAALVLKRRLLESGLIVRIFLPPNNLSDGEKGVDWNDVLLNEGPSGFPQFQFG